MHIAPMIILVVDDSQFMREYLTLGFEALGHKVLQAANGLAAMKKMNYPGLSAVISDIQMPEMDGIEFLKIVREHKVTLPIYLISSCLEYTESMLIGLGATGYKSKENINFKKLVTCIENRLR